MLKEVLNIPKEGFGGDRPQSILCLTIVFDCTNRQTDTHTSNQFYTINR